MDVKVKVEARQMETRRNETIDRISARLIATQRDALMFCEWKKKMAGRRRERE